MVVLDSLLIQFQSRFGFSAIDCYHRPRGSSVSSMPCSIMGRVLGGRMIGRSDDAMCGLHHAYGDEECGFLG
jgi:hypothetical protein